MNHKKILVVFGTRPEAIKMAPLVNELKNNSEYFETKVCVTAQHREMLDQVMDIFDITPDFDLDIMKSNQDLFDITIKILNNIKEVLNEFKPDLVLVHGDTTTTFATALGSFYSQVDIGHVEAGLRTYNIYSPFPEEANRQLTSNLTKYHFVPTTISKQNLLNENIPEKSIVMTGNTVIDSLLSVVKKINTNQSLKTSLKDFVVNKGYTVTDKKFILVTGHRRENFGEGFLNICNAIKQIAFDNPDVDIVYPVHLNPNVKEVVHEILSDLSNVYLIEPLEYQSFVYLMSESYLILTDSGGIQEEAPSLGKPVLVMREVTERIEAVNLGVVKLVGTDFNKIVNNTNLLLTNQSEYEKMAKPENPYGDGTACKKIISFLKESLFNV